MVLPMWTMLSPWSKQLHGCSCQGCKATNHTGTLRTLPSPNTHQNSPEPSGTRLRNLHQHTPGLSGTFRNLPRPSGPTFRNLREPASGTYASIHRNPPEDHFTAELSGTFRNLTPEPTPAYAGTLRNLPEPASGTYTSKHRSSPQPSGTCLRNLHQHTPEPSGTFRNPPPEPTPAHTGTLRNLPEPSSGTCSCNPHRHTPELIWAEDPISLRCWRIYYIHSIILNFIMILFKLIQNYWK